jgi:DNA-binding IclR family transcriptional regulator
MVTKLNFTTPDDLPGRSAVAASGMTRQGKTAVPGPADDNQLVSAVVRALDVLAAFRPGGPTLGNAALAELTGLPKPTVSRLTYTLMRSGYLSFDRRTREYELGPRAVALGAIALSRLDVRAVALPLMEELSQAGFNVGLGIRDDAVMVYTDACQGSALVGLRLYAGSRIPIMGSAIGMAYLTTLAEAERIALLDHLRPRYADRWPTLMDDLDRATHDIATLGYCVSVGGWHADITGVAAPIRVPSVHGTHVVNLGGPGYMLTGELIRRTVGPGVARLARDVRTALSPMEAGDAH